jgi:hypothetical protein
MRTQSCPCPLASTHLPTLRLRRTLEAGVPSVATLAFRLFQS